MNQPSWMEDPVLKRLISEATEDLRTVGLILGGSRGAGRADEASDYDLYWVLTDEAYDQQQQSGESQHIKQSADGQPLLDIVYTCLRELVHAASHPGWWTPGYASAHLLLDKNGEVAPVLQSFAIMPEDKAIADAAGCFDDYLNSFYRSLKAWRRQDELGARLHAVDSIMHLVRTLFSLEQRWPPYHDRLRVQLALLEGQGWPPGMLPETFLGIVRTGDPKLQQKLEARVEALMRDRGYGNVLDGWGNDIEQIKALHFD